MVFNIHLQTVIQCLDTLLIEEAFYSLHQSSTPLSRDDLDHGNAFLDSLIHHPIQLRFNLPPLIVNVV